MQRDVGQLIVGPRSAVPRPLIRRCHDTLTHRLGEGGGTRHPHDDEGSYSTWAPSPFACSQTLRTRLVLPIPASPCTSTARAATLQAARNTLSSGSFVRAAGQHGCHGSGSRDTECGPAERLSPHFLFWRVSASEGSLATSEGSLLI